MLHINFTIKLTYSPNYTLCTETNKPPRPSPTFQDLPRPDLPRPSKMTYDSNGVLIGHATNCKGICCNAEVHYSETSDFKRLSTLFGLQAANDHYRMMAGESLWQIYGEEMIAVEDRLAAEAIATAPQREADSAAAAAAFDCKEKAERVAIRVGAARNRNGAVAIVKRPEPCKFLYNCQGTPARPTTLGVTTECWSHEYRDPKTGAIVAKHVCDRLHPGEAGWLPQWITDRRFKAAAAVRVWEKERFPRRR